MYTKRFIRIMIISVLIAIIAMVFIFWVQDGLQGIWIPFSNRHGSPDTDCASIGCPNKIASSGDTAYCSQHSNNCNNCGCYIDAGAIYCSNCMIDSE